MAAPNGAGEQLRGEGAVLLRPPREQRLSRARAPFGGALCFWGGGVYGPVSLRADDGVAGGGRGLGVKYPAQASDCGGGEARREGGVGIMRPASPPHYF